MKLHVQCVVLTLVSSTVLAILPIPELQFKNNIDVDEDTEIKCILEYKERMEVNLEIKGNTTLQGCEQKTEEDPSKNMFRTIKICTVEVKEEMHNMEFLCEACFKTQRTEKMYIDSSPTITDCPNKLDWIEGEENSFYCKATGYPAPNVICKKDKVVYKEGENFKTFRNMSGTYVCEARNFDIVKKDVEVSVQYKPKVLEVKVSPPLHSEGDTVTLTCKADGEPAPTLTWKTIQPSNVQFSPDNKTITIQGMKKSHLGKYMCTATNKLGSHSLEEELILAVLPKISNIKVEPSMDALEGDNITLSCEAGGNPPPTLSWVSPSLEVDLSHDNRTLKIWRLQKKHIGHYSCTAQNKHGKDSRTQLITLAVKPKVLSIKATPSTLMTENGNLTLTCVAEGIPQPIYSWHLPPSNVLFSPDKSTINILAIQKTDGGNYSCTAQNKHGRDTMTKSIIVKDKGDRTETSITIILTMLMSTILMFYLS